MRKDAFAIVFAAIVGLLVGSSCSGPDQSAENTSIRAADRATEQNRAIPQTTWWTDLEITAEMNLTDDQAAQIKAAMADARTQVSQGAELERRATTRFHRLLSQEDPDPELVDILSAELEEVLSARYRIRINRIRKIREILTQEQWEKLWQLAPTTLQVGHVRVFRGPRVFVTDGTPVPDNGGTAQTEPTS